MTVLASSLPHKNADEFSRLLGSALVTEPPALAPPGLCVPSLWALASLPTEPWEAEPVHVDEMPTRVPETGAAAPCSLTWSVRIT